MKILLFSRPKADRRNEDIAEIFSEIERYGFDYAVNREFAELVHNLTGREIPADRQYGEHVGEQDRDTVMVCYGGDGTLLEGIHRLNGEDVPVVGINAGHLGFLAMAPRTEIANVFRSIADGNLHIEKRTMLQADGMFDGVQGSMFALNEVSVQRLGATMIAIEVSVDGERVSTYNGDGIIVSTPTGSTAYSLSAGGPIISPSCRAVVLTPMSPHNLTMRPIVMSDGSVISLRIRTRGNTASISIDNRTMKIPDGASFVIKLAERVISLAVPHNISFYGTLRDKMMWGIDVR